MLARLKLLFLRAWMRHAGTSTVRSPAPESSEVRNIDIWQFGGVGDMLLATPVIRALGRAYPDAAIRLWCSHPAFAGFLKRLPKVEQIYRFPVYDFDARTLLRQPVRRSLRAVRDEMRAVDADMVVNLHIPALLDWWTVEWWLIRQLRPRYALGFDPHFIRHGSIYTASLDAATRDGVHYTTLYQRLLEQSGIPCDTQTQFPLTDTDRDEAARLLAEHGAAEGRRVCMHIGGNRLKLEGKMWPVERFAGLAKHLLADGMIPVLVGVQDEQPMGGWLCERAPGCINLIGQTQVEGMAALIAMAEGFIGHDSGPFHIAVAVGTPCVAICGRPDAEDEYLKYDREGVAVVRRDDPSLIGVDEVYACAVESFAHGGGG